MSRIETSQVVHADCNNIERAAEVLLSGGLVAFPTETVYGLGALAHDDDAIYRLFSAKGRPADHPVIVHLAHVDCFEQWGDSIPRAAHDLAEAFWPGPLTLVVPRAHGVGDILTGGQDSIAIRVPSHPIAQKLLELVGEGVAAPSANRFGRISPTLAQHVAEDLGDRVDLILDAGPSQHGLESTILDVTESEPRLLRPGCISVEDVTRVLGSEPLSAVGAVPRAPGLLARHYAPRTTARLLPLAALQTVGQGCAHVGVLSRERPPERFQGDWRIMPRDPVGYGEKLYASLRDLDREGLTEIIIEEVPDGAEWLAINDRLTRATRR